jgi:peptidoglycan/xylan/chitin deacetylase (PgdA/CDA1 family)
VLFAAGGLTLLASGAAAAAAMGADRGGRSASLASGRASSSATPSRAPSPTRSPATARPSASPTGSLPPATEVATSPQYYIDDAGPMAIALSLDDGPNPTYTPQVLEVLAQYKVAATFNMIGEQVGANLSLVREVAAAGHTITNHTWNHDEQLPQRTYAQVCAQIDRCNDALAEAGQHPTIFRAPGGNWGPVVYQACAARGLRPVDWTVDPRDWDQPRVTTDDIVRNVLTHTRAHDIILDHDGGGDRSRTVAALKIYIPILLERGYTFAAI